MAFNFINIMGIYTHKGAISYKINSHGSNLLQNQLTREQTLSKTIHKGANSYKINSQGSKLLQNQLTRNKLLKNQSSRIESSDIFQIKPYHNALFQLKPFFISIFQYFSTYFKKIYDPYLCQPHLNIQIHEV